MKFFFSLRFILKIASSDWFIFSTKRKTQQGKYFFTDWWNSLDFLISYCMRSYFEQSAIIYFLGFVMSEILLSLSFFECV